MNIVPDDLLEFRCTENYFKTMSKNVVYTDGAQFLFKNGGDSGAYWLLDYIMFSILPKCRKEQFIVIELDVKDNKTTIRAQDGNDKQLYKSTIPYTDMSDGDWRLWIEDGECGGNPVRVILLPSEH